MMNNSFGGTSPQCRKPAQGIRHWSATSALFWGLNWGFHDESLQAGPLPRTEFHPLLLLLTYW